MRIFLAGTSFKPAYGGPAVSVARLAGALVDAGMDVGVWSPDGSVKTSPYLPDQKGVVRLSGAATVALDEYGPVDVIHDNGLWLAHHHALAAIAAGVGKPRVVSTRGMLEPWAFGHKRWKKAAAWRFYQRRDLCRAACHHATSAVEAANLEKLQLGVPVVMIPNGVDLPSWPSTARPAAPRAVAERVALFLGRLYPVKGLPMLIDAWAAVRPPRWRLQIAGPDEAGHRAVIERRIAACGLEHVVSLVGEISRSKKTAAFAAADVFVLPSYTESFGMAVAEALAHGLPVLTTTGAPWPQLNQRGCGWSVPPTVEGLAQGLGVATSAPSDELAAMGCRGREWMEADFGWDAVAQRMIEVYRGVLQ